MTTKQRRRENSPRTVAAGFAAGVAPTDGGHVGPVALSKAEALRRMAAQKKALQALACKAAPTVTTRLDADARESGRPAILNAATWLAAVMPAVKQILSGLLDAGAKMLINGSSKSRKTFLVIQLALCLAAGRRFLNWTPPKACHILLLQGEVAEVHFHSRLIRGLAALGLTLSDLGDRLQVVNSRGHFFTLDEPPQWLVNAAGQVDVVIIDPVYKFFQGEENSGTDAAAFLRGLDRLTEQSGAAVVYVHHTAKGTAGDRQTIDRGSGSGVFARDFDASLYLGQHREADDVLVVEPIVRAYAPHDPFCIEFREGAFVESDHVPTVLRSSDRRGDRTPPAAFLPVIREVLGDSSMNKKELVDAIKARCGATRTAAREAVESAISSGGFSAFTGGWPRSTKICQKSQCADNGAQGNGLL